ncbi:hypothetical protein [uncultured Roseobacter sp.]|uniref:hypothetical protein n=1 Tax=uncultured Roseobacter sp. TaxID=114847 RepID=UPI0026359DBC|nr:hypothetical protein [uncultured Roseobacter sp.]
MLRFLLSTIILIGFGGTGIRLEAATSKDIFKIGFDVTISENQCNAPGFPDPQCVLSFPTLVVGETYRGEISFRNLSRSPEKVDFSKNWSFDPSSNSDLYFACSIGPHACPISDQTLRPSASRLYSGNFDFDTMTGGVQFIGNFNYQFELSGQFIFVDDQGFEWQSIKGTISNVGPVETVPLPANALLLLSGLMVPVALRRHRKRRT